jgi:hypothetical protein
MKNLVLSKKSAAKQLRNLFNFNSFYGLTFTYVKVNKDHYSVTYIGERTEFNETKIIHRVIIDPILEDKPHDKGCFRLVPTSLL